MAEIRLSEAMRLGSMLRRQSFGVLYSNGKEPGSCAYGAALEAVRYPDVLEALPWAWAESQHEACPERGECGDYFRRSVIDTVVHLNDDHRWTRERIAEWVEGIEPKEAEAATGHESHEAEVCHAAF